MLPCDNENGERSCDVVLKVGHGTNSSEGYQFGRQP